MKGGKNAKAYKQSDTNRYHEQANKPKTARTDAGNSPKTRKKERLQHNTGIHQGNTKGKVVRKANDIKEGTHPSEETGSNNRKREPLWHRERSVQETKEETIFKLKPSNLFLEQLDDISSKAAAILKEKLKLVKKNPYRYKRIEGYNLFLCRIRFAEHRRKKRLIYLIDKKWIKVLCILDRKKDYKDLKRYLKRLGYL